MTDSIVSQGSWQVANLILWILLWASKGASAVTLIKTDTTNSRAGTGSTGPVGFIRTVRAVATIIIHQTGINRTATLGAIERLQAGVCDTSADAAHETEVPVT